MTDKKSLASASRLNIAKVGSKNRVCPPPETIAHLSIQPGDLLAFVLKTDKDGKNYATLHSVKEENFGVEDEEITVGDIFKK